MTEEKIAYRALLVLRSVLLVLLVQTTCQDQQHNEAAFGTSEAFAVQDASGSKESTPYFMILVSLSQTLHRFCNSFDAWITYQYLITAKDKYKINYQYLMVVCNCHSLHTNIMWRHFALLVLLGRRGRWTRKTTCPGSRGSEWSKDLVQLVWMNNTNRVPNAVLGPWGSVGWLRPMLL